MWYLYLQALLPALWLVFVAVVLQEECSVLGLAAAIAVLTGQAADFVWVG